MVPQVPVPTRPGTAGQGRFKLNGRRGFMPHDMRGRGAAPAIFRVARGFQPSGAERAFTTPVRAMHGAMPCANGRPAAPSGRVGLPLQRSRNSYSQSYTRLVKSLHSTQTRRRTTRTAERTLNRTPTRRSRASGTLGRAEGSHDYAPFPRLHRYPGVRHVPAKHEH